MAQDLVAEIEELHGLLRSREGGRGDLETVLKKRRRQLPRRIYRQGLKLAAALPLLAHPKLQMTVDQAPLRKAAKEVRGHLKNINVADRRRGRVLDVLGSMGFAVLAVAVLLITVLRLRGFV
ncbi:hypothetical protein KMP13_03195 [Epibacterium ulvae]|uniref:hypothetical protein n=1 Tax=Epibacterium ulvae TaxID=1156985 RepID=UPI001BFC92B6|nr:hypothetical protein [Epibacterium ulvae]MBT8152909.1 hypothetical protein [Epibacterium ulvae]